MFGKLNNLAITTDHYTTLGMFYRAVFGMTVCRVTTAILPWKISAFNGAGIEQPAMDHVGFRVKSLDAFKKNLAEVERQNLQLRANVPAGDGHFGPSPA